MLVLRRELLLHWLRPTKYEPCPAVTDLSPSLAGNLRKESESTTCKSRFYVTPLRRMTLLRISAASQGLRFLFDWLTPFATRHRLHAGHRFGVIYQEKKP